MSGDADGNTFKEKVNEFDNLEEKNKDVDELEIKEPGGIFIYDSTNASFQVANEEMKKIVLPYGDYSKLSEKSLKSYYLDSNLWQTKDTELKFSSTALKRLTLFAIAFGPATPIFVSGDEQDSPISAKTMHSISNDTINFQLISRAMRLRTEDPAFYSKEQKVNFVRSIKKDTLDIYTIEAEDEGSYMVAINFSNSEADFADDANEPLPIGDYFIHCRADINGFESFENDEPLQAGTQIPAETAYLLKKI